MKKINLLILTLATVVAGTVSAQSTNSEILNVNTVTSAVPFLRVNPDGRTGAMGDVGVAMSADANAIFTNPARLAFIDSRYGISVSFVPWLRNLVNDVYMADLVGYYKIKDKQTIAGSLRYFSLGTIQFTNNVGMATTQGNPREFALDFEYARNFGDNFALAAGLRYIYSNLSATATQDGTIINPGQAIGADLSMIYRKPITVKKLESFDFNFGLAMTNIGSKMSYTSNAAQKDYIPTNLGIGFGAEMGIDEFNAFNLYFDINKLMVPTPDTVDVDGEPGVLDYKEKSPIGGMFSSFGDAPGGFSEEIKEYTLSVGAEYVYDEIFAVRMGYFHEAASKGNRQFLTAGAGISYSIATLNFAYNIPTSSQRNPLDNTMRFSLLFDFGKNSATPAMGEGNVVQ